MKKGHLFIFFLFSFIHGLNLDSNCQVLNPPQLISPMSGGYFVSSPGFQCSHVDGNSGYRFSIARYSDMTYEVIGITTSTNVESCTFSAAQWNQLEPCQNYYWSVRTRSASGDFGPYRLPSWLIGRLATVLPGCANTVYPGNNTINIPLNATLQWSYSTGQSQLTGCRFYFGTTNPPPLITTYSTWQTSYTTPNGLAYGTTYFWKVEPMIGKCVATGCDVWSFSTIFPPPIPNCAINPSPGNGLSNVNTSTQLNWSTGNPPIPTGYKLYFGTGNNPPLVGTYSQWNPPINPPYTLLDNTTYHWKIIPTIESNSASGCPEWSFTTAPCANPPNPAVNPHPTDGEQNIPLNTTMDFDAGSGTEPNGFKFYFGENSNLQLIGSYSTWNPPINPPYSLSANTSYSWQIVPTNNGCPANQCPIWSFTTMANAGVPDLEVVDISTVSEPPLTTWGTELVAKIKNIGTGNSLPTSFSWYYNGIQIGGTIDVPALNHNGEIVVNSFCVFNTIGVAQFIGTVQSVSGELNIINNNLEKSLKVYSSEDIKIIVTCLNGDVLQTNTSANFSILVTTIDNIPIKGLELSVNDPSRNSSSRITTNSSGYASYSSLPFDDQSYPLFSFIYGNKKQIYALLVYDGIPWVSSSGMGVYYTPTILINPLTLGMLQITYSDLENCVLNAMYEEMTTLPGIVSGLWCTGAATSGFVIGGLATMEAGGAGAIPGALFAAGIVCIPLAVGVLQDITLNAARQVGHLSLTRYANLGVPPSTIYQLHGLVDDAVDMLQILQITRAVYTVSKNLGLLSGKVFLGKKGYLPTDWSQELSKAFVEVMNINNIGEYGKTSENVTMYPNWFTIQDNFTKPYLYYGQLLPNSFKLFNANQNSDYLLPVSTDEDTIFYIYNDILSYYVTDSLLFQINETEMCYMDTATIMYNGIYIDTIEYIFDFDNGIIISGDSLGPYRIIWNSTGEKHLTFYYIINGQSSPVVTKKINVIKNLTPIIMGNNTVCQGDSGLVYRTGKGKLNYQWQVSAGGIITGGGTATSDTIVIRWDSAGIQYVSVNYHNPHGCDTVIPTYFNVNVNPNHFVSLNLCDNIVKRDSRPFKLKGGLPYGGVYSGIGVSNGIFYPSVVPVSEDTAIITYTYNTNGCSNVAYQPIRVFPSTQFTCGDLYTDVRDNKNYPTKEFGNNCWMIANLNFGTYMTSTQAQVDNCLAEKYCYKDISGNCFLYGGLYQWDELMQYYDADTSQGLCPSGWRIPNETELNQLFQLFNGNAFAGDSLKAGSTSGFNALYSGGNYLNNKWDFLDSATFFWSSSQLGPYKALVRSLNFINHSVSYYPSSRANAFSVRCIQDHYPIFHLATITTDSVTNITKINAICGGNVLSDGGTLVLERGICWSTSPQPTITNDHTSDGAGTGAFLSYITGLSENTTYYVRAYAINIIGTTYGHEVSFTTLTSICFSDNFNDGDYTNNPHWDFFPSGSGCHTTGIVDVVNNQFHEVKSNSPGCGTETSISHSFNLLVTDSTRIYFDINPVFSDVGGGAGWTNEEYPAFVGLRLWNVINDSTDLRFCYNYRGGASHSNGNYIFIVFPNVPQNVWQIYQNFRVRDFVPDAVRCSKIIIGGNGWDYEGLFDNIILTCQ